MDRFDRRFHYFPRRSNDDADNTEERQNPEDPEDPANCLCATCQNRHRLRNQHRMATLAHQLDQSLDLLDRERTSVSATPRRPAGPRPSRSLPLLAPRPTRDLNTHSILDQFDTTAGSELYRALTLGSQSELPDIQQYAELGAQNEHAQPGSSRPAPNRLPARLPNYPPEYPPPPYETQERDGRNRHIPPSRPTPRYHDQRRYSQPQRSGGENANLHHRGVRPAPYELPPAIPRHFVSGGINNFHMPARTSPTPTGFPPAIPQHFVSGGQNNFYVPTRPPSVLQQHRRNDGQSGFAQIGYSTVVQSSLTTEVQANRGNAVAKNEEKDDFMIDSEKK